MFYLFFLLLFQLCELTIIIPFKTGTPQLDFDDSHFDYLLSNEIYSSFLIGNPPQNISIYYLFLEYQFYLSKYNDSHHYDIDKSFTYTLIKYETFINTIYYRGSYSTDHFNLTNEKNKSLDLKLEFIYATHFKDDSYDFVPKEGIIGLSFYNPSSQNHSNFITSLKQTKVINSYIWSIKYNNENSGNIIFGGRPDQIEPDKYNFDNLKWTKSDINKYTINWYILFDQIYFGEKLSQEKLINFDFNKNNSYIKLEQTRQSQLIIERGLIKGSKEYKNLFLKIFENDCEETNEEDIIFYSCKLSTNIEKLPSLFFIHRELNYTFTLDSNDLFVKELGKYYFLVYFYDKGENTWIFGKPFFKKYQLIFDHDKKMIGFYNGYTKKSNLRLFLIIIFLIIILILSIFVVHIIKQKRRKRRLNEIEDDYDYFPEKIKENLIH